MADADLKKIADDLEEAGVEIYRTRADDGELEIAERHRYHIMDSGVRVGVGDAMRVHFTARTQRSDYPRGTEDELFARVRETVGTPALARGYEESTQRTTQVNDPVDDSKVLDTWYEITYARSLPDTTPIVDEVKWALSFEKYVRP